MSGYLLRLKKLTGQDAEKRLPHELTKLPKGAFVSYVSDHGKGFRRNDGGPAPAHWGAPDPRLHFCACGASAPFGFGWSRNAPEIARWFCAACSPARGRA